MSADGSRAGVPGAPALSPDAEAPAGARVVLAGAELVLRPTGALYWPAEALLCIGDLHLGRGERLARRGAGLLPPYETRDTLDRLAAEVAALGPRTVVCLGDSFDDLAAGRDLAEAARAGVGRMAAGRHWVWVAGNHDPGPPDLPGTHREALALGPLVFRHIARDTHPSGGEISAHFHPKARLVSRGVVVTRRCFLADPFRLILPAFGTYTGGLDAGDAAFDRLLGCDARAFLIGAQVTAVPRAGVGA